MPKSYEQNDPQYGGGGDDAGPEPVPTPTDGGNPATVVTAACGSGRALNNSITTPSNVSATVKNIGQCDVDVRLLDDNNAQTGNTVVAPGKQQTITGSGITNVDVVCLQTPGGEKCRFTYRIVWS